MSDSVRPRRRQPTRLPRPWDSPTRTLEWVAISFSNAWKWKVKVKSLSHVRLLATPWTAAYQASPSMGFSRQEYWSGVPLPSPSVYYEGYSVSSIRFLCTVVDKMFIWTKFTHSGCFSSLIAKMSMFTLAIYCLTTSSLSWLMYLTFQVPMQALAMEASARPLCKSGVHSISCPTCQ